MMTGEKRSGKEAVVEGLPNLSLICARRARAKMMPPLATRPRMGDKSV
jgi:hypothetical protein